MQESHYYHVFNRGAGQATVYVDEQDYDYFMLLMARLLGPNVYSNRQGYQYPNYHNRIRILAFCLMPNHFHMFLEVTGKGNISRFMQSLKIAYAMYFNRRHGRHGVLFETKYHAKMIKDETYFLHIGRYIHMNALYISGNYALYRYSSLRYYLSGHSPSWFYARTLLKSFGGRENLWDFHRAYHSQLAAIALTLEKV